MNTRIIRFALLFTAFVSTSNLFSQNKLSGLNSVLITAIDRLIVDYEKQFHKDLEKKYVIIVEVYEISDSCYFIGRTNDNHSLRYWDFAQGRYRISITPPMDILQKRPPSYYLKINNNCIFIYNGFENMVIRDSSNEKKYKAFLEKNFRWLTGAGLLHTWVVQFDEMAENKMVILSKGL